MSSYQVNLNLIPRLLADRNKKKKESNNTRRRTKEDSRELQREGKRFKSKNTNLNLVSFRSRTTLRIESKRSLGSLW